MRAWICTNPAADPVCDGDCIAERKPTLAGVFGAEFVDVAAQARAAADQPAARVHLRPEVSTGPTVSVNATSTVEEVPS